MENIFHDFLLGSYDCKFNMYIMINICIYNILYKRIKYAKKN